MSKQKAREEPIPLSIQTLQDEWSAHPLGENRAWGGRRALGGFLFQLYLSLDQFFAQVLQGKRDAQFLFDGLSDIARFKDNIVYLTQVKASLRSDSLRSAVEEALALDRFLGEQHPELLQRVRFQLVVRRAKTSQLPVIGELTAEDINLNDEDAPLWPAIRDKFLPITIQANPKVDLAIRLWPHATQCFALVEACLGRLFDLIGQNRPSAEIAESLLEVWDQRRTQEQSPGKLFGAGEIRPASTESRRIVHGVLPGPGDLAEGCFMDRAALLQMALAKILETSATLDAIPGQSPVPFFWIAGPSGSGKSVLLLQMMRELLNLGEVAAVNYLGGLAHTLPRSLSYWNGTSERVLITIDDLYAPENRDSRFWNEVAEVMFNANWGRSPWVLTCGPTEQLKAFNQMASRNLQIKLVEIQIQPMNIEERSGYQMWYQDRTGVQVALSTEPIFVAAAWTYELHRQTSLSPEAFAWKFHGRLAELGLQAQAQAAIALNQYGLQAPDALFAGCEAQLDQLAEEQIYRLVQPKEGLRQGRFFHQRVARIIYNVIVPETEIRRRAEDLARGFSAMLETPQAADAFMAWLNLPKTQSLLLNPQLKKETLSAMWSAFHAKGPREELVSRLKRWHEMAHTDGINLDGIGAARQIREWLDATAEDAPAWGLLFQMVWDDAGQDQRELLYKVALPWLKNHFEGNAWNWIWQRLWAQRSKDRDLTELGYLWLYDHPQEPAWGRVWQCVFDSGVREPELLETAIQALPLQPESAADFPIWEKIKTLQPNPAEFLKGLTLKLARVRAPYFRQRGVDFILEGISQKHLVATISPALSQSVEESCWSFLWRDLTTRDQSDQKLLSLGRDWLQGHEEKPEWSHVWRRLVELGFENERLLPIGRDWLQGHEEKPEWNYVWQRLVELGFEKERLLPIGRDWLQGHEEKPEWAFVWQRLVEPGFEKERLLPIGRDWLQGHEEKPEWAFVWQRLVELGFEKECLLPIGRDWLQGRKGRAEYPYVYKVVYGRWPSR